MKQHIFPAIRITLVCLVFFSGVYTLIILGLAQIAPNNGKGKVMVKNGKTYYTDLGQKFTNDKYFWSRPSAVNYNAAASGASNKGPSNEEYLKQVQARIDTFLIHHPDISKYEIPSELVTSSGSGLDPNLSVQAATIQAGRIARQRGIAEAIIRQLIVTHTEKPLLGLLGVEKVNVLQLNMALDDLK